MTGPKDPTQPPGRKPGATAVHPAGGGHRTQIAGVDTPAPGPTHTPSPTPTPTPIPDEDRTRIAGGPAPTPSGIAAPIPASGTRSAAGDADRTQIAAPALRQTPPKPVEPGALINNNYRVQAMLSSGGMGEVYRAENVFTGDPVALKIVLPSLSRDQGIIDLFMREARILGQLTDDAIVRYHNFVLDQGLGRYCLIMEYIDGTTLWDHVDAHGSISAPDAMMMIAKIADGLAKAHARGVTHRDLSPDNVMLRGDRLDEPVLIDFGIARAADFGEGALAGRFAGKFKYISPEQLGHFGGEVGPRADIYSMALMVAAVLRGRAIDMGADETEASLARQSIPDLSGLPHEVYPLLQYMLEPDPAARPASMVDVASMARDPTRIPLRYRHPLWGQRRSVTATGLHGHGATTGMGGTGTGPLLDSDSPFGAPMQPAAGDDADTTAAARRRPMLIAGVAALVLALGIGGFVMMRPAAPVADPDPAQTAGSDDTTGGTVGTAIALPGRQTDTREGFLAQFDAGPCTQVQRIAAGLDSGKLATLADGPRDFNALLNAYEAAYGARPALVSRQVAPPQCPALMLARDLQGRAEPPPVLSLDSDRMTSGGAIAGRVREAQGRVLWLFLVDSSGGVHDLSSRMTALPDGSFTFSFGMAQGDATEPVPQIIMALASRNPLVAPAAAAAGAPAADLLPAVRDEIARNGGFGAADIASFQLMPVESLAPSPAPDPAPEADGTDP